MIIIVLICKFQAQKVHLPNLSSELIYIKFMNRKRPIKDLPKNILSEEDYALSHYVVSFTFFVIYLEST